MKYLHELAVAAIMRDEGHYLREWLDFHLLAGVSHFYLFDNGSTDMTRAIVKPYVDRGLVTYEYRPDACEQLSVYRAVLQRYRFLCRYIAFLDLDEFLYAPAGGSLPETLRGIAAAHGEHGGVAASWCCYGSSGERQADYSRGVLERFIWRAPEDYPDNIHIKSIVDPRKAAFFYTPHTPWYFLGAYAIDADGERVADYRNPRHPIDTLRINHYYVKSHEEWVQRRTRRLADTGTPLSRDIEEWFRAADQNAIRDAGILAYQKARQGIPVQADDRQAFVLQLADAIQSYLQGGRSLTFVELLACMQNAAMLLPEYLAEAEVTALVQELSAHLLAHLRQGTFQAAEIELFLDVLPVLLPSAAEEQRHAWCQAAVPLAEQASALEKKYYHMHDYYLYQQTAQLLPFVR